VHAEAHRSIETCCLAARSRHLLRRGWVRFIETKIFKKPIAEIRRWVFCFEPLVGPANTKMKTQTGPSDSEPPSHIQPQWKVVAAFAVIYIVWGSTYLGIRYAIESIPPFLMAGSRSFIAGLLLYVFAKRGQPSPSLIQWRNAIIAGALMLTIGNGGVTWVEQTIPSGVTALIVALVPLWMVVIEWLRTGGTRPRPLVIAGLIVGFAGVAFLARGKANGIGPVYIGGVIALMLSAFGWALGSIFSRHASKPASLLLTVAMQMIAGGALLLLAGCLMNEPAKFSFARITPVSVGAWIYLTAMGSLLGFTAYGWLLQVSTPAKVSTSAYVNPLIAVLLGCTIGREPFSRDLVVAGALIIVAVTLIVRSNSRTTVPIKRKLPAALPSNAVPE
jgi:drug/metabolite transporter (DMT)-like permease